MSKIDELIAEFCPEGVASLRLDEVFEIRGGFTPSKGNPDLWSDGTVSWFRMEDIRANGRVLNMALQNVSEKALKGSGAFSANSIIVSTSATIGEHALITVPFLANQRFTVLTIKSEYSEVLSPKFAFYLGFPLSYYCTQNTVKSGFAGVEMVAFRSYPIRLPPLEVQREIVSILDKFTQLEAELEAELEARRSQLEAIRDSTLFEKNITWPEVSLGEVADLVTQRARADGRRVYVGVENLAKDKRGLDRLDLEATQDEGRAFESMDVLLGNIRPYLRKVWHADKSGITNGDVLVLRPRDQQEMSSEFLMQVVSSERFFQHFIAYSKGAKMPRGDKESLLKFIFRLPPISRQLELCNPLRDLSTLTISQIDGIPAEITARRKQYEYYRNQLLTFRELETA
jgi:type I restriction enzyme S subunit